MVVEASYIPFDMPNIIVPNQNQNNRINLLKKKKNQKEKKLQMADLPSHLFSPFFFLLPYLT